MFTRSNLGYKIRNFYLSSDLSGDSGFGVLDNFLYIFFDFLGSGSVGGGFRHYLIKICQVAGKPCNHYNKA